MRSLTVLGMMCAVAACSSDPGGDGNTNNTNQNGVPVCGNGDIETGEACDDGANNSDATPDACRTDCRLAFCGDGVVDQDESCDDGPSNSDNLANACRRDCTPSRCGDAVLDAGEACDDGNADPGDGCDATCATEPFWSCAGSPSLCDCTPYHFGADCAECLVYVNQDPAITTRDGKGWSTAFAEIQRGIDVAATARGEDLCAVWVAEGTYQAWQGTSLDAIELRSGVSLSGSFAGTESDLAERDIAAHPTVLTGENVQDEGQVFHVVRAVAVTDVTVDGFTITMGGARGEFGDDNGGGLYAYGSELGVVNCHFGDNGAEDRGGALFAYASAVGLFNVTFEANFAPQGGGIAAESASVILEDVTFTGNAANYGGGLFSRDSGVVVITSSFVSNAVPSAGANPGGGGLAAADSVVQIDDSSFDGNQAPNGGAIYLGFGTTATIARTLFHGNAALAGIGGGGFGGAVMANDASDFAVSDSIFTQNLAESGGSAVRVFSNGTQPAQITHCTIIDNPSPGSTGGAVALQGSGELEVANSILWGPTGGLPALIVAFPLTPDRITVIHSMVENGWSGLGTGNLGGSGEVPDFVNAAAGDFHLASGSLCIDAADDALSTPTDFEGNPRVNGGPGSSLADMGALEYHP